MFLEGDEAVFEIECCGLLIDSIQQYGKYRGILRDLHRFVKRLGEQRATDAGTLEAMIDGDLCGAYGEVTDDLVIIVGKREKGFTD